MKFAYLIAQSMVTIDSGVIEADSMVDFFETYWKEKGYAKNKVLEANETQYRSFLHLDDGPMTPQNTAGLLAFVVP